MPTIDSFIENVETELGNSLFVTPARLIELGLFGSQAAAHEALKRGILPSIRVSEHRILIPKSYVIAFIRDNLTVKS